MENNIGKLNAIFLQNISNLLKRKDGPKLMKEYTSIISKNKMLLREYMLFDYIDKIENTENLKDYISEGIAYLDGINRTTLKEFNEKVAKFMNDNKIEKIDEIQNEKLYEALDSLIFTKKTLKTINERVNKLNQIVTLIKENKKNKELTEESDDETLVINEDADSFFQFAINKFNDKYNDLLTEEEKMVFKAVTSPTTEEEKQLVFEEQRKNCIDLTNSFLKESIDSITREKLLNVKEKLLEQKFNENTFFDDILSLVELKQTLS
jgi:hypothetical protein